MDQTTLENKDILGCLAEKQIALDGKKLKGVSSASKGNSGLYITSVSLKIIE